MPQSRCDNVSSGNGVLKRVGVKSRNSGLSVASLTSASPSITLLGLAFYSVIAQREGNYEAFYCSRHSWIDGRRNGFNIGVGISMPGPQFEWSTRLGAMASFLKGPRDLQYAIVVLQGGSTVISPSVGNSSGSLVIFATTAFRGSNRTARNLRAHTLCRLQPNRQSRRYSDPCRVILSRISTPQARCRAELSLVRLCQSIEWRMACRRDYHAAGI